MAAYSFQTSITDCFPSQSPETKASSVALRLSLVELVTCPRGAGREAVQENTKESEAEPDVTPFDAAVDLGLCRGPSVLVVVVSVSGVAVAVVHIVDVITVRHRDVAAILTVLVVMSGMRGVFGRLTLVVVTRVASVQVAVMHVVNVIIVRYGDVATAFTMRVVVADMLDVSDRQRRPYTPLACHD